MNFSKLAVRVCLLCCLAGSVLAQRRPADPELLAHEWGTFTSIAGSDGRAVMWTPVSAASAAELPGFVERLHIGAFKSGLSGTVRMETPVLYFYSPHSVNVSVRVHFAKGIITEWYPHADEPVRDGSLADADAYRKKGANGSIFWSSVKIEPGTAAEFPTEPTSDLKPAGVFTKSAAIRYYAARQTASAPLRIRTGSSDQHEKFLFYRGVAGFPVPVTAVINAGGNVVVRNSFADGISSLIWFERRGDAIGYRVIQEVEGEAVAVLEPPEMTARPEHLYGDLEEILVARGLYRDEAHAMIETWRDTWFEEGSRLLYIVPPRFVDSVLPLTVTPAPAQTTRVFVGRMELVTPAIKKAVAAALAANDQTTLAKYGRFLEPILEMIKSSPSMAPKSRASAIAPCEVEPAVAASRR
jgi:hypothetical protein